jgi:hypothetical protein
MRGVPPTSHARKPPIPPGRFARGGKTNDPAERFTAVRDLSIFRICLYGKYVMSRIKQADLLLF